ncbi:DUF4386 domain-containing protein [Paenibacillus sp. HB172176]|uniref:DUF4386 domain-containing protein n=1 Tax=Paenibacillus sp. HB172176 TaxID=2493690 RepID=UPI001439F31C|nr:DUF4386 domain-containing protein [Paenibacillus sp. HB172176]
MNMNTSHHNQSIQNKPAVIAGLSLLIMTIAAAFSYGYAHSSLIVSGEPATTFHNLQASRLLFDMEIVGWVVIILTDIFVSWSFYILLKPVHRQYSLLAGWLRLLYTAVLATAVSHLVIASRIVRDGTSLFNDSLNDRASQTLLSVTAFESIWSFGLILFGVHLIVTGLLALMARQIPTFIGILLMAAGFSYALIHVLYSFMPQLDGVTSVLETILGIPMFIGELSFGIWLLLKGRKTAAIR